jgi:hypothetical protein
MWALRKATFVVCRRVMRASSQSAALSLVSASVETPRIVRRSGAIAAGDLTLLI